MLIATALLIGTLIQDAPTAPETEPGRPIVIQNRDGFFLRSAQPLPNVQLGPGRDGFNLGLPDCRIGAATLAEYLKDLSDSAPETEETSAKEAEKESGDDLITGDVIVGSTLFPAVLLDGCPANGYYQPYNSPRFMPLEPGPFRNAPSNERLRQ